VIQTHEHRPFQLNAVDAVIPKLANSPKLTALLASYNNAVTDPANELVHLYEIRDALAKHYRREAEACKELQSDKEWQRLRILAKRTPLKQGRHRGKHSILRRASAAELDEARKMARSLILAFANHV